MFLLVVYAYFEENRVRDTHLNYDFFIKNAYINDSLIHYIFVINGSCTINMFKSHNISIINRTNEGYDFGAYSCGLKSCDKEYDYYFFLNSSVRGPFILPFYKIKWYMPYILLIKDNIKLVGSSINVMNFSNDKYSPHVQSYAFMMDNEAITFLLRSGFFDVNYNNYADVVNNKEIYMSTLILKNGWNISALIPEYQDIDYTNIYKDKKFKSSIVYKNNILFPGKLCNGRDLHPYELIFMKVNKLLSINEINSLTHYFIRNIV